MPKKRPAPVRTLDVLEDTACVLTSADTKYWHLMNDEETEALALGIVTPSLQERARALLSWKRDQAHADTNTPKGEETICPQRNEKHSPSVGQTTGSARGRKTAGPCPAGRKPPITTAMRS